MLINHSSATQALDLGRRVAQCYGFSSEATLTAYDTNTKIYFRSEVPTGLTVIPITSAVGEQVAAVVPTETVAVTSDYTVPMLGIPTFKRGDDTKLKINFSGAMEGARANIFIQPHKHGRATEVRMRFHDLKQAPKGTAYILWAVSPDNQYQRLGEIVPQWRLDDLPHGSAGETSSDCCRNIAISPATVGQRIHEMSSSLWRTASSPQCYKKVDYAAGVRLAAPRM